MQEDYHDDISLDVTKAAMQDNQCDLQESNVHCKQPLGARCTSALTATCVATCKAPLWLQPTPAAGHESSGSDRVVHAAAQCGLHHRSISLYY